MKEPEQTIDELALRKLPIGIQSFEKLRTKGYMYVDKTELIYRLVSRGDSYFLSRPRRFGKSLLLSTLEAYFQGKKELFSGLAMERLEKNWTVHPVIHLDLNAEKYDSYEMLEKMLKRQLEGWEEQYDCPARDRTYSGRFISVIQAAY
ncbi:MAG: AAA family ATPase, partial [Bacteroides sp.]